MQSNLQSHIQGEIQGGRVNPHPQWGLYQATLTLGEGAVNSALGDVLTKLPKADFPQNFS